MFDIGWSEMAIILLVALIVIGPRDLPRVARTIGRWVGKGRAMAREFQTALEDMARETELDTVKKEIEKAARTDIGKTIEKTVDPTGELGTAFDPKAGAKGAKSAKSTSGDAGTAPAKPAANGEAKPAEVGSSGAGEPAPAGAPAAADDQVTVDTTADGDGSTAATRAKVPAEPT